MSVRPDHTDTSRAGEVWRALQEIPSGDSDRSARAVAVIAIALAVTRKVERERCAAATGIVKAGLTNGGARNACDAIRDNINRDGAR